MSIKNLTDPDVIERLHYLNRTLNHRVSFSFVTRSETGELTVHERDFQPCYGELRKYEESHPGDCTRPLDRRPSDLRYPFPEGNPVAVGFSLHLTQVYSSSLVTNPSETDKAKMVVLFQDIFSETSPWKKGFGLSNHVEFTWDINDSSKIKGIVIKTGNLDPTVLVSLMRIVRGINLNNAESYYQYRDAGLEQNEALLMIFGFNLFPWEHGLVPQAYTFNTSNIDLRRWFARVPYDLTGGTWYDRYDYNRPAVQDIFRALEGEGVNLGQIIAQRVPREQITDTYGIRRNVMKLEALIPVLKEVFAEFH